MIQLEKNSILFKLHITYLGVQVNEFFLTGGLVAASGQPESD